MNMWVTVFWVVMLPSSLVGDTNIMKEYMTSICHNPEYHDPQVYIIVCYLQNSYTELKYINKQTYQSYCSMPAYTSFYYHF